MVLEYIEGAPKEPGWYFFNHGNNNIKAVFVHPVQGVDGTERLYADIDILSLPVETMNVNAWAGPIWLRTLSFEVPEAPVGEQPEAQPSDQPAEPVLEPEIDGIE